MLYKIFCIKNLIGKIECSIRVSRFLQKFSCEKLSNSCIKNLSNSKNMKHLTITKILLLLIHQIVPTLKLFLEFLHFLNNANTRLLIKQQDINGKVYSRIGLGDSLNKASQLLQQHTIPI